MRRSSYPRCQQRVHRAIYYLVICFANQPFMELWPTSPVMGMEVWWGISVERVWLALLSLPSFAVPKYRPPPTRLYTSAYPYIMQSCFFFFASIIQALHPNGTSRGLFAILLHWLSSKYGHSFWFCYQITVIWRFCWKNTKVTAVYIFYTCLRKPIGV